MLEISDQLIKLIKARNQVSTCFSEKMKDKDRLSGMNSRSAAAAMQVLATDNTVDRFAASSRMGTQQLHG